jgi:uncharacterized membrane protein YesL
MKTKRLNPFFAFMDLLGDLAVLNLLFVLCSIPLLTIGTAFTALLDVELKLAAGEGPSVIRTYFSSFRRNFARTIPAFLLLVLTGAILVFDIAVAAPSWPGILGGVILAGGVAFLIAWLFAAVYLFPLLLLEKNRLVPTVRRALLLSAQKLPLTLALTAIFVMPVLVAYGMPSLFLYILPFFAVILISAGAYGMTRIYMRVFDIRRLPDDEIH